MARHDVNYPEKISKLTQRLTELTSQYQASLSDLFPQTPDISTNFENVKSTISVIINDFFITKQAVVLLEKAESRAHSYLITFDELNPFYEFNSHISRRQASILLNNGMKELVGAYVSYGAILLRDNSISIYFNN